MEEEKNASNDLVLSEKQVKKTLNELSEFIGEIPDVLSIVSRIGQDSQLVKFNVLDKRKLEILKNNMVEIHRATKSFGRKNTNITNKLMTITMLNDTCPYRMLRQCLAQIENRRMAIKENLFKLLGNKLKLEELEMEVNCIRDKPNISEKENLKAKKMGIKILKAVTDISDSIIYIEGAFKEIASFQQAYNEIKKNKNIPDNWDEKNFEENEIFFHVRRAINLAYRDILQSGRANMGTMEYIQQFGMSSQVIYGIVTNYINNLENRLNSKLLDPKDAYEDLEKFLDNTANEFKDCYKKAMNRIGLENLYNEDFLYKE